MPTKLLNFPLLLLHLFSKDPGDHEKRIPWRTRSRNDNSTWTCEKQKCIITYINGYISLYTIFFEHAFKSLRTSTSLSLSVFPCIHRSIFDAFSHSIAIAPIAFAPLVSPACVRTDQFFYKFFNSVITYITNDQQIRRKSKENE